ncbi:MAG: IS4 family transposase [Acidobacteria bacterium]|nr:IS4 family transposase [Acidobacteriota bacterium]
MERRVDVSEWVEFQWSYLISFLGGEERVAELARETGAFERARKIASPSDLLRLLLFRVAGGHSFLETAAIAAESGFADVSDAALVKRFAKSADWLGRLLGEAIAWNEREPLPGLVIDLIDASTVRRQGFQGTDHRLHLRMDLSSNRMIEAELTDAKGGETLDRFRVEPGHVAILDAGYAHRGPLGRVHANGGRFIVRFSWSNLPLENEAGEPIDLLQTLESLPEAEPGDFPVFFRTPEGERIPVRLVAIRKSEPAADHARKRIREERSKKGRQIDLRTLKAAGFTFLLTNLSEEISAASVLALYRFRWQIEMKFKTLKSLLDLDNVPARTEEGLRVWVFAKLLVALLIDALIEHAESFSPWGYPIADRQRLAPDGTPA